MHTGFEALFQYISGANVEKTKVEMTAPVRNYIIPGAGPFCKSNFTISFYLPFIWQDKTPPTPTGSGVSIMTVNPGTYAVTRYARQKKTNIVSYFFRISLLTLLWSFPGTATQVDITQNAAKLAQTLRSDGVDFDTTFYISAGYDPPYRVIDRHNEVWFSVKA